MEVAIEKETSHQIWEEKEGSNNQAAILQKENDFAAVKFVFIFTHSFKRICDAISASSTCNLEAI